MKIAKNFLAVVFGIIIALFMAEIILRVTAPHNDTYPIDIIPHTNLPYRMKPDSHAKSIYGIDISTNSLGFRDGEFDPDSSIRRILVLGDSTTFGYGVRAEDTFSAVLEMMFSSCDFRINPDKFEFINTGHSGFNLKNYYDMLFEYSSFFKPELVVVGVMGNDILNDIRYVIEDGVGVTPGSIWERWSVPSFVVRALRNSALYINVGNSIKRLSYLKSPTEKDKSLGDHALNRGAEDALLSFASYARESRLPISFFYLPTKNEVDLHEYDNVALVSRLREMDNSSDQINFVDLLELLKVGGVTSDSIFTRQDHAHPSSKGHAVFAKLMFPEVNNHLKHCK